MSVPCVQQSGERLECSSSIYRTPETQNVVLLEFVLPRETSTRSYRMCSLQATNDRDPSLQSLSKHNATSNQHGDIAARVLYAPLGAMLTRPRRSPRWSATVPDGPCPIPRDGPRPTHHPRAGTGPVPVWPRQRLRQPSSQVRGHGSGCVNRQVKSEATAAAASTVKSSQRPWQRL